MSDVAVSMAIKATNGAKAALSEARADVQALGAAAGSAHPHLTTAGSATGKLGTEAQAAGAHLQTATQHTKALGDSASGAKGHMASFGDTIKGLGSHLSTVAPQLVGITAAFTAAFALKGAISALSDLGGEVAKLRREMGGSAEDASKLHFQLVETGVGFEAGEKGLRKFEKALAGISDLEDGVAIPTGKAMAANLKAMGISAEDAAGNMRPMSAILPDLAASFEAMPDGIEKTALATTLFGRSGVDLIPFLNRGKEGLADLAKEAEHLGLVLDSKTLDSLKKNRIAMREFHAAIEGVKIQIGIALLPVVTFLAKSSTELAVVFNQLVVPAIHFVTAAISALVASQWEKIVGPLGQLVGMAWGGIQAGADAVLALGSALSGPLQAVSSWLGGGALTAALAALGTVVAAIVAPAIISFTVGLAGMGVAAVVAAAPFIAITLAIAAVGVAIYEAYRHIPAFKDAVDAIARIAWGGILEGAAAIGRLRDAIPGIVKAIADWIDKHKILVGLFAPLLLGVVELVKHFDKVKAFGADLFGKIASGAGTLASALSTAAGAVAAFLAPLASVATGGLGTVVEMAGRLADNFERVAEKVAAIAWDGLVTAAGLTWDGLTTLAGMAWDGIQNAWATIAPLLMQAATLTWGELVTLGTASWGALQDAWVTIVPLLQTAASVSWAELTGLASAEWGKVKDALGGLGEAIRGIPFGAIKDAVTDLSNWTAAWGAIQGAVQSASAALAPFVSGLLASLKGNFQEVKAALGPLAESFAALGEALAPVASALAPIVELLGKGLKEAAGPAAQLLGVVLVVAAAALLMGLQLLADIITGLLVGAIKALTLIVNALAFEIQAGVVVFGAIATVITDVVIPAVTGFVDAITNSIAAVASAMGEVKDTIATVGGQIVSTMVDIGASIIKGLWNGIYSMKDWFVGKAQEIGGWVKDALDVKGWIGRSPPPAAFRIGRDITTGIAAGMDAGQDGLHQTLADWQYNLTKGLTTGKAMSTDIIQAMFQDINWSIQNSGMADAAKMEMERFATSLMDGYRTTGSLANSALLTMFDGLVVTAQAGAKRVADAANAAYTAAGINSGGFMTQKGGAHTQYIGGGQFGLAPAGTDTTSSAPVGYYNPTTDLTWTGDGWTQGNWWRPGDPTTRQDMVTLAKQGMAPQYEHGTDYVPADGLAMLHRGEAVVPASQNNGGGDTYQITIQTLDASGMDAAIDRLLYKLDRRARQVGGSGLVR